MKKNFFRLLSIFLVAVLFGETLVYADELIESTEESLLFVSDCNTETDFSEMVNMALYQIPNGEQEAFYDDFTTLQRRTEGEAYVVLSIPYMRSVIVESYYWGGEAIEDLMFEFSCDGEEWAALPFEKETTQKDGKWNRVLYTISEISTGTGLIKIEFPNNPTIWSPLVGKIIAQLEESHAEKIEVSAPTTFAIPRFGSREYKLTAQVLDQMNLPMNFPITWTLNEEQTGQPAGVQLSSDGVLTVTSEAAGLGCITIDVASEQPQLHTTWQCVLRNALLGDYNDDFKIDESELAYALLNYRVTADTADNWNEVRLIDVNDDGMIDVYDIAYLARYQTPREIDTDKEEKSRKDSE